MMLLKNLLMINWSIQITYIRDLVRVKDIDHSVNITIKF